MTKRKTGDHPDLKMVNPNAAAIDIGSTMHMAAVNPDTDTMPVRAFGTFTQDLHDLAAWFLSCGVTSVAMESTGVYWIPAFEILEAHGFEVILVNARYAKNVPGRKNDVSNAGFCASFVALGRFAARLASHCAVVARYSKPPLRVAALRRNSLDIVDAARPILRAMTQTPRPCARHKAISSRSAKDKYLPDNCGADTEYCNGGMPPASLNQRLPTGADAPA